MKYKTIIIMLSLMVVFAFSVSAQYETGTGLDQLTQIILNDTGLAANIPYSEIDAGANASYQMNLLIIESIKATNSWMFGYTVADIYLMNHYLRSNYLDEWVELHGDDENGEEWGFHYVQNDGATTQLYGENAVNTVADGVYHLGFEIQGNNLVNEDGNQNVDLPTLAVWLNNLLGNDDFSVQRDEPEYSDFAVSKLRMGNDDLSFDGGLPVHISMEEDGLESASVRVTCYNLGVSQKFVFYAEHEKIEADAYMPIDDFAPGEHDCKITIMTNTGTKSTKHRVVVFE